MTAIEREKAYWDDRYEKRYASGRPPRKRAKSNKLLWAAIEEEIGEINHIIDVGCGDLRIWGDRDCQDYVGIDISRWILHYNKNVRRPHWTFLWAPAEMFIPDLTRENVFCFNLIFHILDVENVKKILYNLCRYATDRIFIYTWIFNPLFPAITDGEYQHYHPLEDYILLFNEMGFTLTSIEVIGGSKALYIFKSTSCSS